MCTGSPCDRGAYYKGKTGLLSELGESGEHNYVTNPGAMVGINRKLTRDEVDDFTRAADERAQLGFFGGGGDEEKGRLPGALTIAGLKDYECAPGDIYGKEPTVIKIALSIKIDIMPKIALMMIIRNFYISRLIFMCLSSPPSATLKAMVRTRLDGARRQKTSSTCMMKFR